MATHRTRLVKVENSGTMFRPELCANEKSNSKGKMKGTMNQLTSQMASAMSLITCGFYSRACILFLTGSSLATLKLVQDLGTQPNNGLAFGFKDIIYYVWWIPVVTGVFACIIGLVYPCVDSKLGEPHYFRRDWTSVVRCIAVFIGINHFSTVSFSANKSLKSVLYSRIEKSSWVRNFSCVAVLILMLVLLQISAKALKVVKIIQ